ncbi:aKG-HExxH-type peptide beta-hydroxylase [Lysinibacillus xylanilyticus]|uniref:aKG-HExxH-type peptide beta-hydroxylase n=1 Tax=Lysinibacillus xylanilyticus TaxID=582475 RepID=UPI003CFD0E92
MYSLVSQKEILSSLYKISFSFLENYEEINIYSLKKALKQYYITSCNADVYSENFEVDILTQGDKLKNIINLFELENSEITIIEDTNLSLNKEKIIKALETIKTLSISPLFYLVIDTIALTNNIKSAGSATSIKSIGVIWIQIEKHWTEFDIVEALIHEFTHTLLNLDEIVNVHYKNEKQISNMKTWVPSAIRKELRPVPGVVHSIIVSMEILLLRKNLKYQQVTLHGPSEKLLMQTIKALEALKETKESFELLTQRTQELLTLSEKKLLNYSKEMSGINE